MKKRGISLLVILSLIFSMMVFMQVSTNAYVPESFFKRAFSTADSLAAIDGWTLTPGYTLDDTKGIVYNDYKVRNVIYDKQTFDGTYIYTVDLFKYSGNASAALFNYTDNKNYYRLEIKQENQVTLKKVKNGIAEILLSKTIPNLKTNMLLHKMIIVNEGGQYISAAVCVYEDKVPVTLFDKVYVSDPLTSGKIGASFEYSPAQCNNFEVKLPTTSYSNLFENADSMNGWTVKSDMYTIANNKFHFKDLSTTPIASYETPVYGDYVYSMTINHVQENENSGAFLFNYIDSSNYCYFGVSANGLCKITEVKKGVSHLVVQKYIGEGGIAHTKLLTGKDFHVTFCYSARGYVSAFYDDAVTGGKITIFENVEVTPMFESKIGLSALYSTSTFSNLKVTSPSFMISDVKSDSTLPIDQLKGNVINVGAKIIKNDSPNNSLAYVVTVTENNKLLNLAVLQPVINGYNEVSIPILIPETVTASSVVTLYCWDSFSNMSPLDAPVKLR